MKRIFLLCLSASLAVLHVAANEVRPNIVVMIADDWSFPHASALGDKTVKTPTYDRLVREGVHFVHAFVSAPSCSPSRAAIFAGQHHWRLQTAANLGGSIHADVPLFPDLLKADGYVVGKFGKSHWPSNHSYRETRPLPKAHLRFPAFLKTRKAGQPFFYWYGGEDPHRPYEPGFGVLQGLDPATVEVPPCLPDVPEVRADLCDYYGEVTRFDAECGNILKALEATGELDRTLVVMTSDNGMPFPRAKSTLYDLGTRVPLVVRWGDLGSGDRRLTDFVSLHDFAPTFLEAAGLPVPETMNGRSLMPQLRSKKSGRIESARNFVLTGLERHVECNPQRALRTEDYLLIRNDYEGEWPVAESDYNYNVDPSPTKTFMFAHRERFPKRHRLAFEARPRFELYQLENDPAQLRNLAAMPEHQETLNRLKLKMEAAFKATADPRYLGDPDFEKYRGTDHRSRKR